VDGRRPLVALAPDESQGTLEITGGENSSITLNGLLLAETQIKVTGKLGHLYLRHCTLLPGLKTDPGGTATLGDLPAIIVDEGNTVIEITDCIIGPLYVGPDVRVRLRNSIVDSGRESAVALAHTSGSDAGGRWRIENSTIHGVVAAGVMELASNTIFVGDQVRVQRHQEGCVRFCWLPGTADAPRRYRCLPNDDAPDVRPVFTSTRYGDAAYFQLSQNCSEEIRRGADDGSEIGVFHDLFQPQREDYLRARLKEYLRFGLDAGIFYAS